MAAGAELAQPTKDNGVMPITAGEDLTGTGSSQEYAITSTLAQAIRFSVTVASARIKFGASGVTVTATTGIEIQSGSYDVLRMPPGTTHMAYIGNTANINIVELY